MTWGFSQTDGKSLTAGHGCWKFYSNTGELELTLTSGSSSSSSTAGYAFLYRLMGC